MVSGGRGAASYSRIFTFRGGGGILETTAREKREMSVFIEENVYQCIQKGCQKFPLGRILQGDTG
jgi:hypothetical protein